jgi:NADH-quinone oxidoreductase subunit N
MKSASFIAAAAVATALASYSLEKYRGLGRRMPITAIAFTISLLALAGVPPLNGFWSKLVLFGAAINSGPLVSWGPYLAIAGVLNSALSLGYYAWIIRKMYMEEAPDMRKIKEPRAMVAVLSFAMVFIVGFGVWHAPILEFASKAVPHFGNNNNNNNGFIVQASASTTIGPSSRHFGNNNNTNVLVQAATTAATGSLPPRQS